ncbi:DUF4263 domain-containing protein [Vallitaleaceae bacterium 9-2]
MTITDRDYNILTDEEKVEWNLQEHLASLDDNGKPFLIKGMKRTNYTLIPKAARHYLSLFPNNMMDICDLKRDDYLHDMVNGFEKFLDDPSTGELQILNYINHGMRHHLIASILKGGYDFGHHEAFVFPEFKLGNSWTVDYLIVGRNSGGYEFIFVELESNKGQVTRKDGEFSTVINKGIHQINDWKIWLEGRYSQLNETFEKYLHVDKSLPDEFRTYDSSRIHYVCVAGRRTDYNKATYTRRRKFMQEQRINVMHYDNLIDLARNTIGKATY